MAKREQIEEPPVAVAQTDNLSLYGGIALVVLPLLYWAYTFYDCSNDPTMVCTANIGKIIVIAVFVLLGLVLIATRNRR